MTTSTPQGLSITMADRNYTVSGEDPSVHFQVKSNSLNLILDVGIPGWLNLTLIWNKHMSVTIKISRTSKVPTTRLPVHPSQQPSLPAGGRRTCEACLAACRIHSVACVVTTTGT
jgi:hypothetical protein